MSLYVKRLGRGRFVWPQASDGAIVITTAQLGYRLDDPYSYQYFS
jgi:transposase